MSRVIDAPAARVFAFLADPANHPALDTSGTLHGYAGTAVITGAGHTYVWRLRPLSANRTEVTQIHDWSRFTHVEMLPHLPVVNRDQLRASLDLLADALT
ncbi:hypothetical protein HUW46_08652 [Amycolatopsis sp. CA-230715]|nr:hypothetical protein HUW46_08652 [Amycolatopsis sp. CA-230715]